MFSTKSISKPWTAFSEPSYTSYSNGFFVRTTVSPDGAFVASGSSSGSVYIWEVKEPRRPAILLQAHQAECSSVSWCPSDSEQVLAIADALISFDL
jgi:WD40 repeat protein